MPQAASATPGTIRTRLPRTFYEDHVERDLPASTVVRTLAKQVDVELTWDEYQELLSDARYYADDVFFDDWVRKTISPSARRTVAVLERYGAADFAPFPEEDWGC